MPNYKVTGGFCLEIEDAVSEDEAKDEALEQLLDSTRYLSLEAALDVKAEEIE